MKKIDYFMRLAVMLIMAMTACAVLPSCDNEEDGPNGGNSLDVYPWKDHPQSYIRLFDHRMTLQMLNVQRNGTALQVDYTLTNTGFGEDVTLTFTQYEDSGHDNLGNTYKARDNANTSQVVANINGYFYGISGWGKSVTFLPNQTIKGSFMIKDFDMNATAFSISVKVTISSPKDITLASNRFDFVNIPVED